MMLCDLYRLSMRVTVVIERRQRGSLERRSLQTLLTACGERVGLMTRARAWACQFDEGSAHSPPPLPTVLALDLMLHGERFHLSGKGNRVIFLDRDGGCSTDGSIRYIGSGVDFSALCCEEAATHEEDRRSCDAPVGADHPADQPDGGPADRAAAREDAQQHPEVRQHHCYLSVLSGSGKTISKVRGEHPPEVQRCE